MKNFFYDDTSIMNKYIADAEALKASILSSPNTEFDIKGTKYYVSNKGDDSNDGLTPESAWATCEKVNDADLKSGDAVYFERGSIFRGYGITTKEGITYTAYGEGEKPRFYGSLAGVGQGKWVKTDVPNIWRFAEDISGERDIGNICINGGKCWGIKVSKNRYNKAPDSQTVYNGIESFYSGGCDFYTYKDLKNNLEFYHDRSECKLYMYCDYGDPGTYFEDMEISRKIVLFHGVAKNVVIDNIAVMYTGHHGIAGFSIVNNFTVQNCYLAWIGGSIQFETETGVVVRLGNAVEKYGASGCDGYYIRNCYAYQIYDCAYTVQYQGDGDDFDSCVFKNVEYCNNVAEKCNTGLEVWQRNTDPSNGKKFIIENMQLHDNYSLYLGYGWSHQRPNKDANFFYGETLFNTTEYTNCNVHRHYGILSTCYALLVRNIGKDKYNFHNNVYFLEEPGKYIGGVCENPGDGSGEVWKPEFSEKNVAEFTRRGGESGTLWYSVEKQKIDGYEL